MLSEELVKGDVCSVKHCHSNKNKGDLLFCPTCRRIWVRHCLLNSVNDDSTVERVSDALGVFRNRLEFYETVIKGKIG
jgi:Zn-finger nucleic acid-binding protein